jgi:hypothetical protein
MTPQYELRMIVESTSVWRLEIWQTISPATPRLKVPEHVATIQGPGLRIAENRLLKRLAREKIVLGSWNRVGGKEEARRQPRGRSKRFRSAGASSQTGLCRDGACAEDSRADSARTAGCG